jgi:hypothetical protein
MIRGKSTYLFVALLTFAIGVGSVVLSSFSFPHTPDAVFVRNFYDHEADFNLLAKMADEDSSLRTITPSYVWLEKNDDWAHSIVLHSNVAWPCSEAEVGFTQQRWTEYRRMFGRLNLESGIRRKHGTPDAIYFTSSIDFSAIGHSEAAMTEKGYVYYPKRIDNSLAGTLDGIDIDRPRILYKKLNDSWHMWSVSKPE